MSPCCCPPDALMSGWWGLSFAVFICAPASALMFVQLREAVRFVDRDLEGLLGTALFGALALFLSGFTIALAWEGARRILGA